MTFDRLHHRARISIGARRSLAIIVGDARGEVVRSHRHEIRNANAVEVGHVGDLGNADEVEHRARAADGGARSDRTFDARTAIFRPPGAQPVFIAARVGAHERPFSRRGGGRHPRLSRPPAGLTRFIAYRGHSIRRLASCTTLPHFSISFVMRAANSAGVLATGLKPSVASRSLTSGRATALAISRASRSTISFGVAAGATMPVSVSAS